MSRVERLRAVLGREELDALLITELVNVRYLTGFSGSNAQVLVTGAEVHLLTDPRYDQRARSMVSGCEIHIYEGRLSETSWKGKPAELLGGLVSGCERIGIEAERMPAAELDDLRERIPAATWIPTSGLVEDLRRVKDPDEMVALRQAMALADAAVGHIYERLEVGRTEREIALELEIFMRSNGAEAISFDPIVGSGPLSAHIHHVPSERSLAKGDLVLMDLGARVDGYCSDITRTVVLGAATPEQRDLYAVVLAAQSAAIGAISAGVPASEVDAVARKVIADAGHADHFNHGLGHGVGLAIHELPRLARTSDHRLEAGEVVTVEPGIYLPDSGGIRIEDCVLVTPDGAEVLTAARKDSLLEL
jgi:Xaa-Pro aminopeptidase